MPNARRSFIASALTAAFTLAGASFAQNAGGVVLHTNADEAAVAPLIEAFEERTGIDVTVHHDGTGLDILERAEAGRLNGDVLWLSDPVSMARVARTGSLTPLTSETAADRPRDCIGADSLWHGFGGRAMGFALSAKDVEAPPQDEFSPDQWQSRHAAAPLFAYGMFVVAEPESSLTTGAYFATKVTLLGEYEFQKWCFQNRRQQMRILPSDEEVIRAVGMREAAGGVAPADLVYLGQSRGWDIDFIPVRHDVIDLENRQVLSTGPVVLPNAVGVIKGAENADNARALADFLLSADAERMLAKGPWKAIPVREDVAAEFPDLAVEDAMYADFDEAAGNLDGAIATFRRAFPR
ncbi:MAG: substrate-binding domain-containing protein [Phycisphaerales bacterium]